MIPGAKRGGGGGVTQIKVIGMLNRNLEMDPKRVAGHGGTMVGLQI